MRAALLVLAGACTFGAASADGDAATSAAAWLTAGAAHVAPFKHSLMSTLGRALGAGPAAAITVCRDEAPALAAAAAGPGVRLGRASERLRNPANLAPDWVVPLLADYRDGVLAAPHAVRLAAGDIGYVEPIHIQAMCLTCHGTDPADAVRDRLATLYPEDRARGYREGELRGVFWAEFPP